MGAQLALRLSWDEGRPAPTRGPLLTVDPEQAGCDPQPGDVVRWTAAGEIVTARVRSRKRGLEVEQLTSGGRKVPPGTTSLWTGKWPALEVIQKGAK